LPLNTDELLETDSLRLPETFPLRETDPDTEMKCPPAVLCEMTVMDGPVKHVAPPLPF
jgi:hypothetical protein